MKIDIYEDKVKKELATKTGRAIQTWSFRVDLFDNGSWLESGRWSFKKEHVERIISRLKEGRSSEAFGDVVDVLSNGVKIAEARTGPGVGRAKVTSFTPNSQASMRTTKGGREKPAVVRDMYRAEVDGEVIGEYASQREARTMCAFKAFLTSGKAKLHGQTLETPQGKKISITYTGKGLKAVDEKGNHYAVGFRKDGKHIIKPILPPEKKT